MIEGHGDDLFLYGNKVKVNFSTNIPQTADHASLMSYLAGCGDLFRNYPEPEPRSIERKVADCNGISPENVIVTNGATESIYLLAHAFERLESSVIVPTFREYQDACRIFSHTVRFIKSLDEVCGNEAVVWLCNPNNPTGRGYDRQLLLSVADSFPDTVFVVDQAYADYSIKEVLTVDDVVSRDNMVMLLSMTKQFMVPGLRIGYSVGCGKLINRMRLLRMPWSVNSIAIEAAGYLMDNTGNYKIDASGLHGEAMRISRSFIECGIEVEPTDCNFILAKLPVGSACELKEWLMCNHGILIRDASNFEGLSKMHFRVAAQSAAENDLLINAIKEWISL